MPDLERAKHACWLVGLALCGCQGRALVLGAGRGADAASPGDAAVSFGAPRLIEELVPQEDEPDDDPSLSADRLILCFNSKRKAGAGKEDIWCSERASRAERWATPTPLSQLNTAARETGIALALDGLTLWWSSDRDDRDSLDVYTSHRAARGAAWSAPERVAELSSDADDLVSAVDPEARNLYLARRDDADDDYDLYVTTRPDGTSSWHTPQLIEELRTDADESDAYPVLEGRGLVFTRGGDLQLSLRDSPGARYGAPAPLTALNSEKDDRDAWAEQDLGYVVFSSKRGGAYRLYEADAVR